MKETIASDIALHQCAINELSELKYEISKAVDDKVTFIIKTKHLVNYDFGIATRKNKLNLSAHVMTLILDEAIKKEKDKIDKLIDIEVEKRLEK